MVSTPELPDARPLGQVAFGQCCRLVEQHGPARTAEYINRGSFRRRWTTNTKKTQSMLPWFCLLILIRFLGGWSGRNPRETYL